MDKAGVFAKLRLGRDRQAAAGDGRRARLNDIAKAFALVLALVLPMLLEPIDMSIWALQSRLSDEQPSGEIIYLHADPKAAMPDFPEERVALAQALDRLRAAGAKNVFLDVVLEPSTPAADSRLKQSLTGWGRNLTIVDQIDVSPGGNATEFRNAAEFAEGHPRAWQGMSAEWSGYVWRMPFSYETSGGREPSLSAALGGVAGAREGTFPIDYSIRSRSIPKLAMPELMDAANPKDLTGLAGKTILIGTSRRASSSAYWVPGQTREPPSTVSFHGAETLKRGGIAVVSGLAVLVLFTLGLALAGLVRNSTRRQIAYTAASISWLILFMAAPSAGLRIELSYGLALLLIFAGLRSRSNWKERLGLIDPGTRLPTFRAMLRQLAETPSGGEHVVVAKVHSYETLLRSLDSAQCAAYLLKLTERLRVGDARRVVYVDGHYLAWRVEEGDAGKLRGHLEGLRAIFAAPVLLGDHRIDVGITFGAAAIEAAHPDKSLAAALAAVEETSEALEPVRVAEDAAEGDSLWDLSLRARIDAAMEAGEVFCVYQPKMDIAADAIVGVEALVRWEDPERGFIPPMHFVMQCEKAGRMEYLTRYVLQSACSAGKLLHFRGCRITMSVNISATLLTDMRIVGIVRNVLQATGFDAHFLVLEITETARIRDLTVARSVLKALKALGTHLSMDDFGVGAANFETLQALPFDEIKIDRQFVSRAAGDAKSRAITASIVGMGTAARIAVVAEGAETQADLKMLREIGCCHVQGYALARPMPLNNLMKFAMDDSEAIKSIKF